MASRCSVGRRFWQNYAERRGRYNPLVMANSFLVAGTNSKYKEQGSSPAGFWVGLWHGLIAPFVFFVSLWDDTVSIYETNNNGRWYEFGFMLGIAGIASHHEVRTATGV